jgi:cellobiose phosphorylase
MLNLFVGNELEGGLGNLYLRVHESDIKSVPLLGPRSPSVFHWDDSGMAATGRFEGLHYRIRLVLSDTQPAWFWHVEVTNEKQDPVAFDLIHTQDIGLAHYGAIRLNEYYVSQYIDHSIIHHPEHGVAVASRQNQSMGGRYPWSVIGSLGQACSYATDALQFHGLGTRAGLEAGALAEDLPGKRLQHEHSLVCIQDQIIRLAPGAACSGGFYGRFLSDHPAATSDHDSSWIDETLALPEASPQALRSWTDGAGDSLQSPSRSLFATARALPTSDLSDARIRELFPNEPRQPEYENGKLISFFTAERSHVVLRPKELSVLRPHGHLLRSGGSLTPDESALTSTTWMGGVFHSMVTQGHVSINRFLSTCHTYLGWFRSHGQRVFMEIDGSWQLLGLPSAYEIRRDSCRWIYQHAGGALELIARAPDDAHTLVLEIHVLDGAPARFLISNHVAIHGDDGSGANPVVMEPDGIGFMIRAIPDSDVGRRFPHGGFWIAPSASTMLETSGGDEILFEDGLSRQQPFACFVTRPTTSCGLRIEGRLIESDTKHEAGFWSAIDGGLKIQAPTADPLAGHVARLEEIHPWLIHNALVHYLSPRGLEQYSGGGWGTRDICQGPTELLLALGRFEPLRDLLLRVFRQQNADGDWPQWFMFFERERNIRPGDSHGDIVYWPVLALAQYLTASGDASILDEELPFYHPDGDVAETATIIQHVEKALELIGQRVISNTHLAAYGHGDWNDSLQPADPAMRERLCSAWTVTLNHQTFVALAAAFRKIGMPARAHGLETMATAILSEFQETLIVDGVLAGLVYFRENGVIDYMIHPRDGETGLKYSLLPMIHAIINDLFSPQQAEQHLALIEEHLLGPDGAHLFDHPMAYRGGIQKNFQRAESASYFGREIGIMYMHAHLRYCEALARHGDSERFFEALIRINPIAIRELIPSAGLRQANCYYSSSDPAFADRYEAFLDYHKALDGQVTLEGGWRVYSSGAGISVRLIVQCFLGIRIESSALVIDPVIPHSLSGLIAHLRIGGHLVEIDYQLGAKGCGVVSATLNGVDLEFSREINRYRLGAARIPMDSFTRHLSASGGDRLTLRTE